MNIFPRLLLSVALFVPALNLYVHAMETELSAAHGYVETTGRNGRCIGHQYAWRSAQLQRSAVDEQHAFCLDLNLRLCRLLFPSSCSNGFKHFET